MILRQSTSQVIRFGPFKDSIDGVTPETALTIEQADMQLSKDGGAFAQKNAAGDATHDVDGWYTTTLDTTDSDTVAELYMQVTVAGAIPVWVRYYVVEEAVYDALWAAGATNVTGVDWGNVINQGTTVDLSETKIKNVTEVLALSVDTISSIWKQLTSALTTVGSIGKLLVDNINATISSRSIFNSTTDAVDIDRISGNTTSATQLQLTTIAVQPGAAIAGTLSATQMSTDLTEVMDSHFIGRIIVFNGVSDLLYNQATDITAYNGTTKVLTFTALTNAPAIGTSFIIV